MNARIRLVTVSAGFAVLVGEDEADAASGLISWTAPLAQALLGREAGENVPFQGGESEIVSIEP
jgi:transcription elongation GreA/GreB family factor